MKDPSMIHSVSTRETVESLTVNKYRSIPRQRLLMTKRRLTKLTVTKVRLTRHSTRTRATLFLLCITARVLCGEDGKLYRIM